MTTRQRSEHVVGKIDDFPEGSPRICKVGRRELGIFNIDGRYYALPNLCPHQLGPLCEGGAPSGTFESRVEDGWKLQWVHEGRIVACPWHALEFDIPTGQCLAYPEIRLRSHELRVDGDTLKILL